MGSELVEGSYPELIDSQRPIAFLLARPLLRPYAGEPRYHVIKRYSTRAALTIIPLASVSKTKCTGSFLLA
jgi:hypothetical protein